MAANLEFAANLLLHNAFRAHAAMVGRCLALTELRYGVIHCLVELIVPSV